MTKKILPLFIILIAIFLGIYKININDNGYTLLFKNRITRLGYGVKFCSQKACMSTHSSSFEVWHFEPTVYGELVDKRIYPSFNRRGSKIYPVVLGGVCVIFISMIWTLVVKIKKGKEILQRREKAKEGKK